MFAPDKGLYPSYDRWLETSLRREPVEFFREMFAKNRCHCDTVCASNFLGRVDKLRKAQEEYGDDQCMRMALTRQIREQEVPV